MNETICKVGFSFRSKCDQDKMTLVLALNEHDILCDMGKFDIDRHILINNSPINLSV